MLKPVSREVAEKYINGYYKSLFDPTLEWYYPNFWNAVIEFAVNLDADVSVPFNEDEFGCDLSDLIRKKSEEHINLCSFVEGETMTEVAKNIAQQIIESENGSELVASRFEFFLMQKRIEALEEALESKRYTDRWGLPIITN